LGNRNTLSENQAIFTNVLMRKCVKKNAPKLGNMSSRFTDELIFSENCWAMSVGICCCSFCTNWVVIKLVIAEQALEIKYLPAIYAPMDAKPTSGNTHGLLHERLGVRAMPDLHIR